MTLEALKSEHSRAFRKLAEYAAECPVSAETLAPVLNADSVDALIGLRHTIYRYAACDICIDELESALSRVNASR